MWVRFRGLKVLHLSDAYKRFIIIYSKLYTKILHIKLFNGRWFCILAPELKIDRLGENGETVKTIFRNIHIFLYLEHICFFAHDVTTI